MTSGSSTEFMVLKKKREVDRDELRFIN